jgi:hypothetical protein
LKVLHLPTNIASQISITVRALRDMGVDARGLVFNNSIIQEPEGVENYIIGSRKRHPIQAGIQTYEWWNAVQKAIRWADVIHWYSSVRALPWNLDLKLASLMEKPRLVEFWGTDIRIPEIAAMDNPYRRKLYLEYPELASGARNRSIKTQTRFAGHGFVCLVPGIETETYIQRDIFSSVFNVKSRIIPSEFEPKYPDKQKRRPLIVHMPSNKAKKGTRAVHNAIEQLKNRYSFDFKLIHGVKHQSALEMLKNCDIFLDQFIAGSYGLASVESMALGKPTLCYIKPSLLKDYPSDLPIINSSQENLISNLEMILEDVDMRREIGRLSRKYVEKYHDAHLIAGQLKSIYERILKNN